MNQEKIGKFISEKRKEKKLTQEELSEKLHVSSKSISRWETGRCMPDISLLIQLSEILEVSVHELITGEHIEEKNLKQATEKVLKETIGYSNKELKKQKRIFIYVIIFIITSLSLIFGVVDYNRIKYGYDPIFMLRITSSKNTIHHYLGLGYRVERKVGISPFQPFKNSDYVRFGTWLFTRELKIIKAEPDYIFIRSDSQELRANRGSYCWSEEKLHVCSDTIDPVNMVYSEIITTAVSKPVVITNPYGKITSVKAYQSNNKKDETKYREPIEYGNLEYKENVITLPSKERIYYIAIIIESDQGNVLHSFKVDIKK